MPKSNLTKRNRPKKYKEIYLDYAAGIDSNPSSVHSFGVKAKSRLQNARKEVANILGCHMEEIIFTSGGTESNNLAIIGSVLAWELGEKREKKLAHIIVSNIEHPSVLEACRMLEKNKLAEISFVPVENTGIIDPKKVKKEIKENTILVSVMYANNEIGTIQPIREIAKEIRHYKKYNKKLFSGALPFFHTDAVQAVNYLNLNVEYLGVDFLSLSGSKIEDSGRAGILYKKKLATLLPILKGGDQEMGFRPGTENLQEIAKFSKALVLAEKNKEKENKRLTKLQDYFFKKLQKMSGSLHIELIINGDIKNRLPNNVNITFPKIPSDLLVIELSAKGVMVSAKSACKSEDSGGSYVIKAISPSSAEIGGVRFSFGRKTSRKDLDYTIKSLFQILLKLKKWYN